MEKVQGYSGIFCVGTFDPGAKEVSLGVSVVIRRQKHEGNRYREIKAKNHYTQLQLKHRTCSVVSSSLSPHGGDLKILSCNNVFQNYHYACK